MAIGDFRFPTQITIGIRFTNSEAFQHFLTLLLSLGAHAKNEILRAAYLLFQIYDAIEDGLAAVERLVANEEPIVPGPDGISMKLFFKLDPVADFGLFNRDCFHSVMLWISGSQFWICGHEAHA